MQKSFLVVALAFLFFVHISKANDAIGGDSKILAFNIGAIEPPLADSLELVLKRAAEQDYHTIVFVIDSGGGLVREADAIIDIIRDYPDFEYVSFIRSAISASIWPAIASSKIYIEEGGTIGGAQIYYQDPSTGNYLVDGKMQSIKDAYLRSLAEKNGHPVDIVQAMVVPQATGETTEVEVEEWVDTYRYEKITIELKEARVSTYTAMEAFENGLAESVVASLSDLYPTIDHVNYDFVNSVCYARYMAELLHEDVFSEKYTPDVIASRLNRKTKSVSKWVGTSGSGRETKRSSRPQNDREYERSKQKVRRQVLQVMKQCESLIEEIDHFLQSDRGAILMTDSDKQKTTADGFIQAVLSRRVNSLRRQIDNFEPMMVGQDYAIISENFDVLEEIFISD